jgi:15-cis-phytoene synthase
MVSIGDLETYARRTSSALFAVAARTLSGSEAGAVAEPAGIAYAIVGLLCALPLHAARRQLYVPTEILNRHQVRTEDLFAGRGGPGLNAALAELRNLARQRLIAASKRMAELPSAALPAFLPVVLVKPSLARLERSHAFAPADIAPWWRQWLIWRAARDPARIAG